MTGDWRFYVAAFVLAGLTTAPAFSNALTDLLNPAPKESTPKESTVSAPARETCARQPGKATPGLHWVYRLDDHRKCWYQADEAAISKRRLRHHFVSRSVHDEDEAEPHKRPVMDAHAQLLSTTPTDARPSTAPAPDEVADAAPAPALAPDPVPAAVSAPVLAAADAAAKLVAAAPAAAQPTIDQYATDNAAPRRANAELLLAALNEATDSSAAPAAANALPAANEDHQESATSRMGMVLIAMGLAFLIGAPFARRFLNAGAA
jgi:hypothetical protein